MKAALRQAGARGIRIEARDGRNGRTYRLTVEARGRGSDIVLENQGVPLYVSPSQMERMPDLRVDYIRREGREGFTVQALEGCGCGPDCACAG